MEAHGGLDMTAEERARWCIAQAEAIEAVMRPQVVPHEWDAEQMAAHFWRDMARRVMEVGA